MENNTSPTSAIVCPTPSWPATTPCSGRGLCEQGICVCQAGWTGKHDFLDTFNTDCATDENARTILFAIAYAIASILIISTCYMLIKHRPLVLLNPTLRKKTRFKNVYIQGMLMLQFLIGLCVLATIMLAVTTRVYLRESVAQTILVIIINICLFTTSHVQTSYLMQFALSSILENRQRNLLSKMRKFLSALWLCGSTGIVITFLGNLLSVDAIARALFGRLVFGVWTLFGSVAVISVTAKFGYDILQTLNESIEMNDIPELVEARKRLRMVIFRLIGVMVMFGAMCFVNAMVPIVLAQAYPIAGLFICLDGLIRTWGEFRPDLLREDQSPSATETTGSST